MSEPRTQIINKSEWFEIKDKLDQLHFWQLPVLTKQIYLDGTAFIIEGYNLEKNYCTGRNYHATNRISPSDTTQYYRLFKKTKQYTEN